MEWWDTRLGCECEPLFRSITASLASLKSELVVFTMLDPMLWFRPLCLTAQWERRALNKSGVLHSIFASFQRFLCLDLSSRTKADQLSDSETMGKSHVQDELLENPDRVCVTTRFGNVTGGRASTGAAVFLEIPYALPPKRFQDPEPLPDDYRYEQREYIRETAYAVQPRNDGQAGDSPFEDKVGRGQPTENPLFLNIVAPPAFPRARNFPVKVYIHGGFLQFGSPHSLSSQAQFISAERSEVWVNIGYRLSAFGFLACDNPPITGNFGFKDQWLALQWIRDNIDAFGGNASDIQIAGFSAGAHSVHQLLHYASHLPEGHQAPFQSAILQSNAILTDPKTPQELRPQFNALCRALQLDPESPDILETLQDPLKVPWSSITGAIETDGLRVGSIEYGTFRGCQHDSWVPTQVGHMAWQRSGAFSRGLLSSGVRSIIIGNVAEEWYLYSIAHPISSPKDIVPNLERYFQHEIVKTLVDRWTDGVLLPEDAAPEECQRLFGELLSFVQVYLPVQLLARDLAKSGYPIARYTINWIPEQCKHQGYTTHGTDRVIWTLRKPELTCDQHDVAKTWLHDVAATCKALASLGKPLFGPEVALTLCPDSHIAWRKSENWEKVMDFVDILPGEGKNEGLSRL